MDEAATHPEASSARVLRWLLLLAVVAVAAAVRLWGLGARTMQGDEAVYSLVARQIARGGGYEQVAALHGPLHYFATAAVFRAFGTGDFTARLVPALFGVALAALPFAFTRQIGRRGAFAAVLMLAVSPTLTYYSRFARADVMLAFFSLAAAVATWRYLAAPQRVHLYLLAVALAFLFVTSEMALVVTAIFVAYLDYRVALDLFEQMRDARRGALDHTHYELLGVGADATAKQIRLAYKHAVDATADTCARSALAVAYHTLTHETRRAAYDRKLARRQVATVTRGEPGVGTRAALLCGGWLIVALWPFVRGLRERAHLRRLPDAASPLLLTALLALPFYGPLVQKLPFVGRKGFAGEQPIYYLGVGFGRTPGGEVPVMLATLGALFALAMLAGLAWRWHVWVICWALFYGITITLFTGFYTNSGGIWTGLWGTLDTWMRPDAQISVRPAAYYATLVPVYELLPVAVAAIGALGLVARGSMRDRAVMLGAAAAVGALALMPAGTPLLASHRLALELLIASTAVLAVRMPESTKFLAFWSVAAFFAYTRIETKEPWLAVQIVVPLTLLAGRLTEDALAALRLPHLAVPHAAAISRAPAMLARGLAVAAVVGAAALTLRGALDVNRSAETASTVPARVEALQPARTSGDVRAVLAAVGRAAQASGKGTALPIALDAQAGFAQTWFWYLRDYSNLKIEDMRAGYQVPAGAVALVSAQDAAKLRAPAAAVRLPFVQEWTAQPAGGGASAADVLAAGTWAGWGRDLIDHGAPAPGTAMSGIAYFPGELRAAVAAGPQGAVLSAAVGP
ncbi:MAG: TIGR03663 family protein [Chloroflexota bacterium]|nr:TIGR03663 family protein [Chloroflexota bacterium]